MKLKHASFKTSTLAKKCGFNVPTHARWGKQSCSKTIHLHEFNPDYEPNSHVKHDWNDNSGNGIKAPHPNERLREQCSAPTLSMLQQWLIDKHGLIVLVDINTWSGDYMYKVFKKSLGEEPFELSESSASWDSYDEALESGIQWVLSRMNKSKLL